MLSLYERLKIDLMSDPRFLIPIDISRTGDTIIHIAFTEEGGLSLYRTHLSEPEKRYLILPEGVSSIGAQLSSDDKWIMAEVDFDGTEKHQICKVETKGIRSIPELKKRIFSNIAPQRFLAGAWSPDDDGILFAGSRMKSSHVSYVSSNLEAEPRILLDNVHGPFLLDWKHDNVAFVICHRDQELRKGLITVFDCDTGERIAELDTLPSLSTFFLPEWHPTKSIVPFLQPEGQYGKLALFDLDIQEKIPLEQPEGQITTCRWNPDGNTLYVQASKDARTTISSIDVEHNALECLNIPAGTNYLLASKEWKGVEQIFYAHTNLANPLEVWIHDLQNEKNNELTSWNDPLIGTNEFPLVDGEQIKYPSSYDELTIHGFFFKPESPPPEDGYPLITWIHGGPTFHYSDSFFAWFQILVQEGFAVFAPNYRGSTGYNQEFTTALYQEAGRADLEDVSSGADYVVEKYDINPERIGIGGRSYGGFMTLAALAFQPNRWAGGYAVAPIADWYYMYENADSIFRKLMHFIWGDPEENKKLMIERSPISKVDKVQAPLGIEQPANDSRTPLAPVLEFANRLYDRNHELALIIEPSQGHASFKKDSAIRNNAARVHFFKRVLQDK